MRSSIPGAKVLLKQPPTPESVQGGRRLVPLLGNIHNCSQRGLDLGREQETTSSVLHQLAFQGAEARYPRIEKITFALIVTSRKLCTYFQANPIIVMTDQPIKKAMHKPEAAGRMIQWAIELNQFDVQYRPQMAIKA